MLKNNIWINYFLANENYSKENWIDFENEISKLIQLIDKGRNSSCSEECEQKNEFIKSYFSGNEKYH